MQKLQKGIVLPQHCQNRHLNVELVNWQLATIIVPLLPILVVCLFDV